MICHQIELTHLLISKTICCTKILVTLKLFWLHVAEMVTPFGRLMATQTTVSNLDTIFQKVQTLQSRLIGTALIHKIWKKCSLDHYRWEINRVSLLALAITQQNVHQISLPWELLFTQVHMRVHKTSLSSDASITVLLNLEKEDLAVEYGSRTPSTSCMMDHSTSSGRLCPSKADREFPRSWVSPSLKSSIIIVAWLFELI